MPYHICFVAPKAYNVLSGRSDLSHIGGAEVQQVHIARGLRGLGARVSFVVEDHGQDDRETVDGIEVFKAYRLADGLPIIRFVHPRITRVWAAMNRADADLYYQRTSDSLTGIVAAFCRSHNRRFVFGIGSMKDCDRSLPSCGSLRERVLYRYGLNHSSVVVAQTQTQQERLRRDFGIEPVVIPNCVEAPAARLPTPVSEPPRILWVGRFVWEKRFNMLLDVAERCGERIAFDVIGDGSNTDSVRALVERASGLPNVRMHGYVPHTDALKFYDGASGLICTSEVEGFPNTFLEAWCRSVPVVTTFDPGGVVGSNKLGVHATGVEALADAVHAVCFDKPLRAEMSRNALQYYRKHHTVAAVAAQYQAIFQGPSAVGG